MELEDGLSFSNFTAFQGELYGWVRSSVLRAAAGILGGLYRISLEDGRSSLVFQAPDIVEGIAFTSDGMLYAIGADPVAPDTAIYLLKIDKDSGAIEKLSSAAVTLGPSYNIFSFDHLVYSGGSLYSRAPKSGRIVEINPDTGVWLREISVVNAGFGGRLAVIEESF